VRTIIRVNHTADAPYLTMSKDTIRDTSLDFDSLGCLVFLLSKPDDWEIRPDVLAAERKVGRMTIYRQLRKLIEAGYVIRKDIRINDKKDGRFKQASLYTVYESKGEASYDKVPF
jgi:DNA-binding MarR family transcriptional regulator